MQRSVDAETTETVEGDIDARCLEPWPQTRRVHRDQRARHARKGCPGTWEASTLRRESEREGKQPRADRVSRSRSAAVRAMTWGNQTRGDPTERRVAPRNRTV